MQCFSDLILRVGVAFAFLYPPIDAYFHPYSWVGYFPKSIEGYAPDLVLLHAFGVVEIVIALWILSGRYIFLPSLVAAVLLFAIVSFNTANIEVVFRDVSIACMALSLAIAHRKQNAPFWYT